MPPTVTPLNPPPVIEAGPRTMSVKDALAISVKLNEVYIDREKGYSNGWTDAKVAADLNAPRDWVRQVRIELHGEGAAGNDEIHEAIHTAARILEECKLILDRAERLTLEAKTLVAETAPTRARIERIQKQISEIEKSLR